MAVLTWAAQAARFVNKGSSLITEGCPNGYFDPGETNTVSFSVKNDTDDSLTDVQVELLADKAVVAGQTDVSNTQVEFTMTGITDKQGLGGRATISPSFTFRVSGACGRVSGLAAVSAVKPLLQITYKDPNGAVQTERLQFTGDNIAKKGQLGATVQTPYPFSNAGSITVWDAANPDHLNKSVSSTVTVSGVPNKTDAATGERPVDIAVTLNNVTASIQSELAALLVSPNNTKVVLFRNAGNTVGGLAGTTFTVSQAGSALIPLNAPITAGGIYKPADYAGGGDFNSPAPGGPYSFKSDNVTGNLDIFDETDVNGTWTLYLMDTIGGNAAAVVAGGWTLTVTTEKIVCCNGGANAPSITQFRDNRQKPGLADITIPEDTVFQDTASDSMASDQSKLGTLPSFNVSDVDDSNNDNITVSAISSDETIIKSSKIKISTTGGTRTLDFAPERNANGSVAITLVATDPGGHANTATFTLKVSSVNDQPVVSQIRNQASNTGTPTPDLAFTVSDVETPADQLTITGTSSAQGVVPDANIVFTGIGNNRTVTVLPANSGTSSSADITVHVNDNSGAANAEKTMVFTVSFTTPVGYPTISPVTSPVSFDENTSKSVGVTVRPGSSSISSDSLQVTVFGDTRPTLIPPGNIVISGTGTERTVKLTPAQDKNSVNTGGDTDITLQVSDGNHVSQTTFTVHINPVNTKPVVTAISSQTIQEDSVTGLISFNVYDVETYNGDLVVTYTSSNTGLVPNTTDGVPNSDGTTPGIQLTRSTSDPSLRTIKIIPIANAFGRTTITIKATDTRVDGVGPDTGSTSFTLDVLPVNDPPSIQAAGASGSEVSFPADGSASTDPVFSVNENNGIDPANPDDDSKTSYTTISLTGIYPGVPPPAPLNEIEQTVTLSAGVDNNSVITTIGFDTDNSKQKVKYPTTATQLRFKLKHNAYGDVKVTLTLTDNGTGAAGTDSLSTVKTFVIRVIAVNNAPTMAAIGNQSAVAAGNAVLVALDIKDVETATPNMKVLKGSTATSVVDPVNIIFDGQNSFLTIKTQPSVDGTATIQLIGVDRGAKDDIDLTATANAAALAALQASLGGTDSTAINTAIAAVRALGMEVTPLRTFTVTASTTIAVNNPPKIVSITPSAATIVEDSVAVASIVVSDPDAGDAVTLKLIGSSSNESIVPSANILFGGAGTTRTMAISPAKDANGSVTVTVSAVDTHGFGSVPVKFDLAIIPVEDTPTISVVESTDSGTKWSGNTITAKEDDAFVADPKTGSGLIEVKIHDAETTDDNLKVTASSSNKTLIPDDNITISSTGGTRTLKIVSVANLPGGTLTEDSSVITVKVKDGAGNEVPTTFTVKVLAVNDAPTINSVPNQTVGKNSLQQTISLSGITAGPKEAGQQLTLSVTAKDKGSDPAVNNLIRSDNLSVAFANGTSTLTTINNDAVSATLSYQPVANKFGTATITVTLQDNGGTANGGTDKSTVTFDVTIGDINNPPTISIPADKQAITLQPGQSSDVIPISVNDTLGETPPYALVLSFTSDNPAVIPNTDAALRQTGSGSTRGLIITANAGVFGTANVTAKVTDTGKAVDGTDVKSATQLIVVTVTAGQKPIISRIDDVMIHVNEDSPILNFTVNDAQTPVGSLIVTGNSDNQTVAPDGNIQFGGSGASRMMIVRPAADKSGTANITVTVKDSDGNTATSVFKLTVLGQPPTISTVSDQIIQKGGTTGSLAVQVTDKETYPGFLTLTAKSSNQTFVPDSNIFLGGSGVNRTVNVAGAAGQNGSTTITLTVTDGEGQTNSTSFKVGTTAPSTNTPPTITAISPVTVDFGKQPPLISFTVGDKETALADLRVTATSSNTKLIPAGNIFLGGTGALRTMLTTVATNQSGSSLMIVTVTDGDGASTSTSFSITVSGKPTVGVPNDFNKDGSPDLILEDADGFLGAWFMSGDDLLSSGFLNPNSVGDIGWKVVGSADFNADGNTDLLFQHTDGSLAVWLMNGVNLVTPTFLTPGNSGADWKAVAIGDFNKDGKNDILFQHTDGTLALWYMDGTTLTQTTLLSPSFAGDVGWKVVGVGDVNGDGKVDIFFQHTDGTIAVWYMDNATMTLGTLLSPSNPGSADWRVVGITDQNGDKKPDLLLQNSKDHSLAVWYLNGPNLVLGKLFNPSNPGGTWQLVAP